MKKNLLILVLGFIVASCSTASIANKVADRVKDDGVTIKIVQINDVYEIDAINNGKSGGLARVAYIRDSIKRENPNTFYFLAGDFLNPSLLGTLKVDGVRLQGKQMIEVLNASDLDLVTFGNHEFDIKEADLQSRLNESEFDWTTANVMQVTSEGDKPFRIMNAKRNEPTSDYKTYTVKNKRGTEVKFSVFGVTLPSNPQAFVYYGDIYDEAVRAYNTAKKESDFVLGLTHVSIDQDKQIAKLLPELPLIMGGHEHDNMYHEVGNVKIAKADANAVSIYVHTIEYNPILGILDLDSELVMIMDKYPSDPKVQAVVDKWNTILDANLETIVSNPNEVIFVTKEPLDGTDTGSRTKQTNLGGIITKSMSIAFDEEPDAVITNGGGIRIDDMVEGELSSKDVFRILPYGGQVLKVDMTGALLKQVLDYGEAASGTGAYLQWYNISKDTGKGWLVRGKEIDEGKVYSIALNDFLMLGLDIPFLNYDNLGVKMVVKPQENELTYDMRKCMIELMKML